MTGMPAATAFLIDGLSADASGIETMKSGRLLVDGGVDQLGHCDHVKCFRSAVVDSDARVLGARDDPVLDHGPERIVGLSVAHDDDVDTVGGDRRRRDGYRGYERRRCGDGRFDQAFHAISSVMGEIALHEPRNPD